MKTYYFEFFDLLLQVYFSRKIKTQCDGSYPNYYFSSEPFSKAF